MAILVFLTVALAFWHFTVFVPDHFRWGIIGALLASLLGGVASGMIFQLIFSRGLSDTDLVTLLFPLPGIIIFLILIYTFSDRPQIKNN